MKTILGLFLFVGMLWSQQVHFSFYEHTTQRFEIPFDTTWREYKAPIDLIQTGQTPLLRIIFEGCQYREFHLDNIRFPSNAYIDFEDVTSELTLSAGITEALRLEHPSDSGFVLHIEFDPNHLGADTLRIVPPDSWFPAVPEMAGLEFQADASVRLNKYFNPPELARYDVNVDDWSYRTVLAEKYNETITVDTTIYTLKRWYFPGEGSQEVYTLDQTSKYSNYHSNLLHLDQLTIDFEAQLDEYVGVDSSLGSWLGGEQYQEVFGEIVFVKMIDLAGIIGHRLHFAYGVGLIREDFPGTSVHADLVGLEDQGEFRGDMNLPVSLSLGVNLESPGMQIFPPDTNWYHYTIPVSDLRRYPPMPTTADSLRLILTPQILVRNHDSGALLFNDLSLWSGQELQFDYGALNHDEWHWDSATNGSQISWAYSQSTPPDGTEPSSLLQFSNGWQGGLDFRGWVEYTTHFSTALVNADASIQFWMKQPLIMTGIDEYTIVIPEEMGVLIVYPNPFNGEVTIEISVPETAEYVDLTIHDILGREIWSIQTTVGSASKKIVWNGQDQHGIQLDSGIYLANVKQAGVLVGICQKLVLLR